MNSVINIKNACKTAHVNSVINIKNSCTAIATIFLSEIHISLFGTLAHDAKWYVNIILQFGILFPLILFSPLDMALNPHPFVVWVVTL